MNSMLCLRIDLVEYEPSARHRVAKAVLSEFLSIHGLEDEARARVMAALEHLTWSGSLERLDLKCNRDEVVLEVLGSGRRSAHRLRIPGVSCPCRPPSA